MEKLTPLQYSVLEAVINGETFLAINKTHGIHNSRHVFESARAKLMLGKGMEPTEGIRTFIPFSLAEWRSSSQELVRILNRHQLACDAAHKEYWRIFKQHSEVM